MPQHCLTQPSPCVALRNFFLLRTRRLEPLQEGRSPGRQAARSDGLQELLLRGAGQAPGDLVWSRMFRSSSVFRLLSGSLADLRSGGCLAIDAVLTLLLTLFHELPAADHKQRKAALTPVSRHAMQRLTISHSQ